MARFSLDMDRSAARTVGMDASRKIVTRSTRRVLNRSAVKCPVDQGYLRASGGMSVSALAGGHLGVVEYTADYAAAVHNGRQALTIRAKGGGVLKFQVDGRTVYARSVRQPARPARPFLADALREVAATDGLRIVSIG